MKKILLGGKKVNSVVKKLLLLVVVIVSTGAVAIGLTLLFPQNQHKAETQTIIYPTQSGSSSEPTITPHMTPTPIPVQFPEKFVTKLFDPSEKEVGRTDDETNKPYTGDYYPPKVLSLINFSDDKLVGLACLSTYRWNNDIKETEYLTNPRMKEVGALVQEKTTAKTAYAIRQLCDTVDNQTLVGYTEKKIPNDYRLIYHLAVLKEGKISDIASFYPQVMYAGCLGILEMTKDNHIYVQCEGGDGSGAHYEIYDVSFTTGKASLVIHCDMDTEFATNSCAKK